MACTQLGHAESTREQEEINSGTSLSQLQEYTSGNTFTEDDFNSWVTFRHGSYKNNK